MPNFLEIPSELRCAIYRNLFQQPNIEILALSREPEHDYTKGPPSDWIADSRQEGLVYSNDADRIVPTNSRILRTCKQIYKEAIPVFYGENKIILYAEDNNDIFFWLLDIGERNRHAIRHLAISWAYGVSIESGRGNVHRLMEVINNMKDAEEEEIQKQQQQLIRLVEGLEERTVRLIIRTLNLLATNQDLISLGVFFPGVDGGDIWDIPNENIYFADEVFSNSTSRVHACIPKAISLMSGLETLTIGYTKDIRLAEEIARTTGAKELIIHTRLEGQSLDLDEEARAEWVSKGWRLEGRRAHKTLIEETTEIEGDAMDTTGETPQKMRKDRIQRASSQPGYSEGGRLKANMRVPSTARR